MDREKMDIHNRFRYVRYEDQYQVAAMAGEQLRIEELQPSWSPEDCLLGFDLGLDQELADSINDMEES